MSNRFLETARFGFDFFVRRANRPFVLGLVTNDTCNLNCRHCRVANVYGYTMAYDEAKGHLADFYRRGARMLYFAGGEPYLWRDGERRLRDLVALARRLGYMRILPNVRAFKGGYAIVYVVNTVNRREIRSFLETMRSELRSAKVMFFFHTPYYGVDKLLLSAKQKDEAIDTILECRRSGLDRCWRYCGRFECPLAGWTLRVLTGSFAAA